MRDGLVVVLLERRLLSLFLLAKDVNSVLELRKSLSLLMCCLLDLAR
jgi:hypothetical protein